MSLESPNSRRPDAVVIGGGLIGSSIALRLAQAGLQVTVFDRGPAGGEASNAAAGMIAPQAEKMGSSDFEDLCRLSHSIYPEFAAEIESLSGEKVNYRRDGTLLVAVDDDQAHELDQMAAEAGRRSGSSREDAGAPTAPIERLDAEAAWQRVPALAGSVRSALFLSGDHSVDNERLTRAVIQAARHHGVTFHENAPVSGISVRHSRVEAVETDQGRIAAGEVILAAGCWSGLLASGAGIEIPTVPCRGQMLEFELEEPLPMVVRAGHSYLVPREGNVVVVGTTAEYAGFDCAVTAVGIAEVLQSALCFAPFLATGRFRRAWAGLRPDTADHLPILGRCRVQGLTLATGHFRNGILLAPVTARLIAEVVVNKSTPPLVESFGAERFAVAALYERRESLDTQDRRSQSAAAATTGGNAGTRLEGSSR